MLGERTCPDFVNNRTACDKGFISAVITLYFCVIQYGHKSDDSLAFIADTMVHISSITITAVIYFAWFHRRTFARSTADSSLTETRNISAEGIQGSDSEGVTGFLFLDFTQTFSDGSPHGQSQSDDNNYITNTGETQEGVSINNAHDENYSSHGDTAVLSSDSGTILDQSGVSLRQDAIISNERENIGPSGSSNNGTYGIRNINNNDNSFSNDNMVDDNNTINNINESGATNDNIGSFVNNQATTRSLQVPVTTILSTSASVSFFTSTNDHNHVHAAGSLDLQDVSSEHNENNEHSSSNNNNNGEMNPVAIDKTDAATATEIPTLDQSITAPSSDRFYPARSIFFSLSSNTPSSSSGATTTTTGPLVRNTTVSAHVLENNRTIGVNPLGQPLPVRNQEQLVTAAPAKTSAPLIPAASTASTSLTPAASTASTSLTPAASTASVPLTPAASSGSTPSTSAAFSTRSFGSDVNPVNDVLRPHNSEQSELLLSNFVNYTLTQHESNIDINSDKSWTDSTITTTATTTTTTDLVTTHAHTQPPLSENSSTVTSGSTRASELPPSYIEFKFGMSWSDFCNKAASIRRELVGILRGRNDIGELNDDQIQITSIEQDKCYHIETLEIEPFILVRMFLVNKTNHFDPELTQACASILVDPGDSMTELTNSTIKDTLLAVTFHNNTEEEQSTSRFERSSPRLVENSTGSFMDPRVTVAISIAVIGGCCCIGLMILQMFVRRRKAQNRTLFPMNRSYSATSRDTIQLSSVTKSRPNSGLYNPGLDLMDPPDPSHPLNFVQLSNFCMEGSKIVEEFQKLPQRMPRQSMVPDGEEDKNRYANVLPLVHTRVKLIQDGSEPRSAYINANYVTGPNNQCQYYIATQAPTERTVNDFWTMIWQQNCKAIVMLTQTEEQGQPKCVSYWPELVGKSAAHKYGDFLIELKHKDVHQEYIVSKLEINNLRKIETRQIDHFWYTCWPPDGVPEPVSLVKLVLDARPRYESGSSPLVVHCSPGTGRTCTFIALDLCMRQFETLRTVDVMKTVYVIRQERAGAIQNKEQYILLYNAVHEYAAIVMTPGLAAVPPSAATLQALLPS